MEKNYIFDVTDNESGERIALEQPGQYTDLFFLELHPKETTPECERTFIRITQHSTGSIEFCMAINGQVPYGDKGNTVSGFPQQVNISIPAHLSHTVVKQLSTLNMKEGKS